MKKSLALVLTLAMLAACLPLGAMAESEPVTVTVWHTWGAGVGLDAMNEIVNNFNETVGKEKGIVVDMNYVASKQSGNTQTMEKLMAAIAAGEAPDVALLDNFQVASWASQNALTPLDELMDSVGLTLDDMYDWAQQGSAYQGCTYSIPYNGDVRCLFVNMDMFEAAGLTEADIPRTIEQLTEVARKLTIEDDQGFTQAGIIPWNNAGKPIYTWGWAFGGDFYDEENNVLTVNDPAIIEAVQWEYDLASSFGLVKFRDWASGVISGSGATDAFIAGKVAMTIKRNDELTDINTYAPDMNLVVAPIPTKDESLTTTWAGGWGWTIPRGAKNPEASIEFMKYVASAESQTIMASKSNSLSVLSSVNEAVFSDNPQFATILEVLPFAQIRPAVPVGQMLWDNLNTVLNNVLYDIGTPESELNALYETINDELSMY
ncbi:MAG: ABC transporter substrate-binding protein [Aristaeellaceae bacterium]